jgi:NAD(P)-dependent dehydrogenase (short-subunit alcohol dehydrogenase family)
VEEGRIVIITGANSGIGKAASYMFAKEGHTVIMACRNLEKSQIVQQEIKEASNNSKVDLMKLDVSSFASIREFCSAFMKRYERLDILIHNAAYFNHGSNYLLSPDHLELTFATNIFGPYLLTELLLKHLSQPKMQKYCMLQVTLLSIFLTIKKSTLTVWQGKWKIQKDLASMICTVSQKWHLSYLPLKWPKNIRNTVLRLTHCK